MCGGEDTVLVAVFYQPILYDTDQKIQTAPHEKCCLAGSELGDRHGNLPKTLYFAVSIRMLANIT